jgi:hypothetical protein
MNFHFVGQGTTVPGFGGLLQLRRRKLRRKVDGPDNRGACVPNVVSVIVSYNEWGLSMDFLSFSLSVLCKPFDLQIDCVMQICSPLTPLPWWWKMSTE